MTRVLHQGVRTSFTGAASPRKTDADNLGQNRLIGNPSRRPNRVSVGTSIWSRQILQQLVEVTEHRLDGRRRIIRLRLRKELLITGLDHVERKANSARKWGKLLALKQRAATEASMFLQNQR